MKVNEEISQAQHVASILSGTGQTTSIGAVRGVAYRAPVHLLAVVDAMATHSGKSRNAMLNLLLQVGIDEVREQLQDGESIERLSILESKFLQELVGQPLESISE